MALRTPNRSPEHRGISVWKSWNEAGMTGVLALLPPEGGEAFQRETVIVTYLFRRIPCQATKDRLKVERRVREEGEG